MVINTDHKPSISRNYDTPQPQLKVRLRGRVLLAALALAGAVPTGWAAEKATCAAALGAPVVRQGPLRILGTTPVAADLALAPGHSYLIAVTERDNDALVEVLDPTGKVIARADHPERRTGTRRAVVGAPESGALTVRVTGDDPNAAGIADVRAVDLAALQGRADCLAIVRLLADADAAYAQGQEISHGHATAPPGAARQAFLRAADDYGAAERTLAGSADQALRGQTQLALAELEYLNLQDWAKAAEWARTAYETIGTTDPYRRARAEARLAAAWIEIGMAPKTARPVSATGAPETDLLGRARATLQRLVRFHQQRNETYDAAFQLTNIALTYLYQSRFQECVGTSESSARLFGSIRETPRQALAWMNTSLCLWGLGRLPEALHSVRRALREIGPEPYPSHYLAVTNNTALLDYAIGDFDESLRLFDRSLSFAQARQSPRDEGQSLYGIGVDYYALGDRERARGFLERALAIRTAALDRRGRVQTLRALATVDADEGRMDEAMALDREARSLAVAQASIDRLTIQLAVHTATAGRLNDAKSLLDKVLSRGAGVTSADRSLALLHRGVLLRDMGRPGDALGELAAARSIFHRLGDVTEEFATNLELARTRRLLGEPAAALADLDRALQQSDAIRTQSANPEFRSQLQTPLRAAHDLKIELLRARYEDALAAGRKDEANAVAAAAFTTADASRARTLADVSHAEYSPAVRRLLAPELRRREALYQELAGRRYILVSHSDYVGSNDPRARHLISDISELQRQLDTVNATIAAGAVPTAQGRGGGRIPGLPTVPAGTALVSYWLGADSAYAWVVLPKEIHWARLPSPKSINDAATEFHRALARIVDIPLEQRLQDARELSALVLQPLDPWLASIRQWIVIPDGALDYVPFAALRAPDRGTEVFVAAHHDVAYTPAAWMLDASASRGASRERALLLVADPVYQANDPRLAQPGNPPAVPRAPERGATDAARRDYQRLPYTAQEAEGIATQFPPTQVDRLIGLQATRERLLALDWSRYRFIHFATHGIVDAQVPELSALVLSSYDANGNPVDGAVRVADMSLRTLHAEVVVFSACDTALGKATPSEGLVGISSTVLARGARAVVASLWPVSDEIGAHLMTEFYRHLLHDSMSPPAALGAAMRSVIASDGSADPALWAAFQVSVVAVGPEPPKNAITITHEETP